MKVLVAVKRVLDYAARVRIRPDQTGVNLDGAKMSMNPFCEIGLEQAVRLKEAGEASEVVAVSVGDAAPAEAVLRSAYASGADRAIHVKAESCPPLLVSQVLAKVTQREDANLLILGKQAIDTDNNQTGQMCAALLGWPQATFASELFVEKEQLRVRREVDEGQQEIAVRLPAVVTTDLRLNTPRYTSFKSVIAAKKKAIERLGLEELSVESEPQFKVIKVEEPPKRKVGKMVHSVEELVKELVSRKVLRESYHEETILRGGVRPFLKWLEVDTEQQLQPLDSGVRQGAEEDLAIE